MLNHGIEVVSILKNGVGASKLAIKLHSKWVKTEDDNSIFLKI